MISQFFVKHLSTWGGAEAALVAPLSLWGALGDRRAALGGLLGPSGVPVRILGPPVGSLGGLGRTQGP